MSNNTSNAHVPSKSRDFPLDLVAVITVMILVFLFMSLGFSVLNDVKKNALATTVINLQQARLAIQEYQTIYHTLPGIQGNKSVLSSKDILGFPNMTPGESIEYVGTPNQTFCLVAKTPLSAYFQYITSASSKVYSVRPTTC